MQFPDFLEFEPFNQLRGQMGAEALGEFEFFDPQKHISAEEKQQLLRGLEITSAQVLKLIDNTLAYKNSRVLVSLWEPTNLEDWFYHLAACEQFKHLKGKLRASSVAPIHATGEFQVCSECLQVLHYKGFDAVRNRHRHYSQQLHNNFNLEEFFQVYPTYPLAADKLNTEVVI